MTTPKPYFKGINLIKAFVLGCDPTAFDKAGTLLPLEFVFNMGKDKRYFSGINDNLKCIGLDKECVYVQNLVTDYQDKCTAENKEWKRIAVNYTEKRKQEFDTFDPEGRLPVLLTSELLYDVLLNEDQVRYSAKDIYQLKTHIPIASGNNKLGRPLIPLYRHFRYQLRAPENALYAHALKELFRPVFLVC